MSCVGGVSEFMQLTKLGRYEAIKFYTEECLINALLLFNGYGSII